MLKDYARSTEVGGGGQSAPAQERNEQESDLNAVKRALREHALKLSAGVDKAGNLLHYILDCREVLLDGQILRKVGRLLWSKLEKYRPDAVGGVTMSADPLTYALLGRADEDGYPLTGFVIRKEPKGYGLRKLIEGPTLRTGMRVVVVDDTLNSGTTIKQAVQALKETGVELVAVATLLDYEHNGSAGLKEQGIAHEYIFTLRDIGLRADAEGAVLDDMDEPELRWTWSVLNTGQYSAPKSGPCFSEDAIFVGSDQGFLLSVTLDGHERWRYETRDTERGIHSTPAHSRGRVYFGAYDGYLYCVDARSGKLRWERQPGDWIGSSPVIDTTRDRVIVGVEYGANRGRLMAFDAESGANAWSAELGAYVHSSPVLYEAENLAIVGCNDGYLYAVDAERGRIEWALRTDGDIKGNAAVDAQGRVFFGSFDGYLYCLNAATGHLNWKRRLSDHLYITPYLYGDYVVAGGYTGFLTALSRDTGALQWSTNLGGRIIGGIGSAGEKAVCVGGGNGHLFYVSTETGEVLRRYKTGKPLRTTPGIKDGQVIVPACDGNLYSFAAL